MAQMAPSTFYFTRTSVILSACSGTISVISSTLTIYIILKSKNCNTYHRIIFFMACCDIVTSSLIASSTALMPNDVIYPYGGPPSIGNIWSCEMQGFLILIGLCFTSWANMYLNTYYLCTIRYRVEEKIFRKLDFLFLAFLAVVVMPLPIHFVRQNVLNPTPWETYCTCGPYPYNCIDNPDVPCIRGEMYFQNIRNVFAMYAFILYGMQLLILIVSMTLIVQTFYQADQALKHHRGRRLENSSTSTDGESLDILKSDRSITRTVMVQASMYILAYLMVVPLPLISFFETQEWNISYPIAKQLLFPLQGFFNSFIFVYHKYLDVSRGRPKLSTWACLKCVLYEAANVPQLYISGMFLVNKTTTNKGMLRRESPVFIDEMNEIERHNFFSRSSSNPSEIQKWNDDYESLPSAPSNDDKSLALSSLGPTKVHDGEKISRNAGMIQQNHLHCSAQNTTYYGEIRESLKLKDWAVRSQQYEEEDVDEADDGKSSLISSYNYDFEADLETADEESHATKELGVASCKSSGLNYLLKVHDSEKISRNAGMIQQHRLDCSAQNTTYYGEIRESLKLKDWAVRSRQYEEEDVDEVDDGKSSLISSYDYDFEADLETIDEESHAS